MPASMPGGARAVNWIFAASSVSTVPSLPSCLANGESFLIRPDDGTLLALDAITRFHEDGAHNYLDREWNDVT